MGAAVNDLPVLIQLAEKAHCRFGDKGDTGLFVLAPYHPADFATLLSVLTPHALAAHFGDLAPTQIALLPCPNLCAVVIIMRNSLGGGVTRSLALDTHGKTRAGHLLGMQVAWPGNR